MRLPSCFLQHHRVLSRNERNLTNLRLPCCEEAQVTWKMEVKCLLPSSPDTRYVTEGHIQMVQALSCLSPSQSFAFSQVPNFRVTFLFLSELLIYDTWKHCKMLFVLFNATNLYNSFYIALQNWNKSYFTFGKNLILKKCGQIST